MDIGIKTYICYKDEDSWELARIIANTLKVNKFQCFMQNDKRGNKFAKKEIHNSDLFILVLERDSLLKSIKSKDQFYKEVSYIIDLVKSCKHSNKPKFILPIIDDTTFKDPDFQSVPKKFKFLSTCNSIYINEKFFNECIHKILNFIVEKEYDMFNSLMFNEQRKINSSQVNKENRIIHEQNLEKIHKKFGAYNTKKDKKRSYEGNLKIYIERNKSSSFYMSDHFRINQLFKKAKRKLNILDLGCLDGGYSGLIFENHMSQINTYIGIDIQDYYLEAGRYAFHKHKNFKFYQLDLNSTNIFKQLTKICVDDKNKPIKFDIIICRFILNYFENAIPILELCKEMLYCQDKKFDQPGVLIIIEHDDKFSLITSNGDKMLKKFYEIKHSLNKYDYSMVGNSNYGREIYTDLYESGFNDIKLETIICNGDVNLAIIDSIEQLDSDYRNVYKSYEYLATSPNSKFVNNKYVIQSYNWLKNNVSKFNRLLCKDESMFINSYMVWTARSGK